MPVSEGFLSRFVGDASNVERRRQSEGVFVSLVDDGTRETSIDAEGEVLLHGQQFSDVVLPVGHLLEAVYSRYGVVSDIVTDAYSPVKQLCGDVLRFASVVHQDTVLLFRRKNYCYVRFRFRPQRLQLDEGVVVEETDGRQVLAKLSGIARGALADVVVRPGRLEADAVLALVMLARTGLRIHH